MEPIHPLCLLILDTFVRPTLLFGNPTYLALKSIFAKYFILDI